jgi:hypothetical protein
MADAPSAVLRSVDDPQSKERRGILKGRRCGIPAPGGLNGGQQSRAKRMPEDFFSLEHV